jgi:hypothetical protein
MAHEVRSGNVEAETYPSETQDFDDRRTTVRGGGIGCGTIILIILILWLLGVI